MYSQTVLDSSSRLARLQAVDWSFSDANERALTHNLHPWPAKFIPQIPAAVIEACSEPGETVMDPFAGCGTTAVEAVRLGRNACAADVNPLASLLTRAKCAPPERNERADIEEWMSALKVVRPSSERLSKAPSIPNIDYWFDPQVIAQLVDIRDAIDAFDVAPHYLRAVFSSIILAVSHQESETRYRRIDRDVPASKVVEIFRARMLRALTMAAEFEDSIEGSPDRTIEVHCADCREPDVFAGTSDLAVFSPPYPNAFDYHLYHRFRLFWLGFDPRPLKHQEIGAHLRYLDQDVWEQDMKLVLTNVSSDLAPGAFCVILVGDGIIEGELVRSGDILWRMGPELELEPVWRTKRPILRAKRSFNLSDSRLRSEDVLVLRK